MISNLEVQKWLEHDVTREKVKSIGVGWVHLDEKVQDMILVSQKCSFCR